MQRIGSSSDRLPADDLEHVVTHGRDALRHLDGARLLITGASGFIGSWMAETLAWARTRLDLDVEATLLIRNGRKFAADFPHLVSDPTFTVESGSIEKASLEGIDVTHVLHCAAPVGHRQSTESSSETFDSIVLGTRRLLELCSYRGAQRFLLLSSGAVYGTQPPALDRLAEDFGGGPDPMNPTSAYGEGKRAAEFLCASAAANGRLETVVARGFSFVGPRLPLDGPYAVGNFLGDGIAGRPIRVTGDGSPWRSYLYAADAALWLWTILVHGASGCAYNVGSDDSCTILQLAGEVSSLWRPALPVDVAREPTNGESASRYVPSIDRARRDLGLSVLVPRPEALQRTLGFHLSSRTESR